MCFAGRWYSNPPIKFQVQQFVQEVSQLIPKKLKASTAADVVHKIYMHADGILLLLLFTVLLEMQLNVIINLFVEIQLFFS